MKSLFRWLLGFEFKTTLGPIVVWAMASAMLLAGLVFGDALGLSMSVGWFVIVVWLLAGIAGFAAFIVSLISGHPGRALVQFILGIAGFIVFFIAFFFARAFGMMVTERLTNGEGGWEASEITEQIPFSVEYRWAHPFLAEYDKRIAFKSGKKIGVWMGFEVEWRSCGLTNKVPFEIEVGKRLNQSSRRVRFKSGKDAWDRTRNMERFALRDLQHRSG